MKRKQSMNPDQQPRKLIQCVKTRWNSVYDMTELHWPVVSVLSNRNITKLADAKTLDLKEEHWTLMEEMLPVLHPLQIVTSLFSAEECPSASSVYPTLWRLLRRELVVEDGDSAAVGLDTTQSEAEAMRPADPRGASRLYTPSMSDDLPCYEYLRDRPKTGDNVGGYETEKAAVEPEAVARRRAVMVYLLPNRKHVMMMLQLKEE